MWKVSPGSSAYKSLTDSAVLPPLDAKASRRCMSEIYDNCCETDFESNQTISLVFKKIWVVVKIMVPLFWVPRCRIIIGTPKRDHNFDNHPYVKLNDTDNICYDSRGFR